MTKPILIFDSHKNINQRNNLLATSLTLFARRSCANTAAIPLGKGLTIPIIPNLVWWDLKQGLQCLCTHYTAHTLTPILLFEKG